MNRTFWRKWSGLGPALSGFLLVLTGLFFLSGCAAPDPGEADAAPVSPEPAPPVSRIPVEAVSVRMEDVTETLRLTGTAEIWDEFAVSSEISGEVARIEAEEGDFVEAGQLLLELDREKRLLGARSQEARLERARVDRDYAGRKLGRARALLEMGAISEAEVETLEQAVDLADSEVHVAEIELDLLRRELEDTRIAAPVSGQVFRRLVSLGETITPAEPLFTIIQVDPLKVVTELSELEIQSVRVGQEAALDFNALPDGRVRGVIHRIEPVANPRTGAFPAIVRVSNSRHRIQPGMVAGISLAGRTFPGAVTAPMDAVLDEGGRQFVYMVKDGAACRVDVVVERRVGERAILSGPLEAGDRLISRGNRNVTEGTPVEVLE